jgi:hypothetical protein
MVRLGDANPRPRGATRHAARDRDRAIATGLDAILDGLRAFDRAI